MINLNVIQQYVDKFASDIQTQPTDNNLAWACQNVYNMWLSTLSIDSVAELGAGNGPLLNLINATTKVAVSLGGENGAITEDMNTPPLLSNSYDLVISRHSLEHSLMPLIMLCEMARISKKFVLVIVPTCTEEMANYVNHYSVFPPTSLIALFKKAGLKLAEVPSYNQPVYPEANNLFFEDRYLLLKV